MRQYQETYIQNTREIKVLFGRHSRDGITAEEFYEQRMRDNREICRLRSENMEILRNHLIPILDDILSADKEEIEALEEFVDVLMKEQLDSGIRYQVCSALVAYARVNNERNLLIKELYLAGMANYNYQMLAAREAVERFQWKTRMLFGEAAGFIRHYDSIEDTETRGYIHRSMGNMALSYTGADEKSATKKLELLRRSLQVLTDPVYHEKTPNLPWDLFIYKSHQERTTLLTYLRSGKATIEDLKEVMDSAQFVYDVQVKTAKKKGIPLQPQWWYVYHAASYHCGVCSLAEFLQNIEKVYAAVAINDYSQQGMYANVYLPAVYADYIRKDGTMQEKKKPVLLTMYRRLVRYVRAVKGQEMDDKLFFYIRCCLDTYIEYPGENNFRDFIEEFVAGRHQGIYSHSLAVAGITKVILHKTLEQMPEKLLGVRGYDTVDDLREHEPELEHFLYDCCIMHDIGKLKILNLYEVPNRSWLGMEEEMHQFHPELGNRILDKCLSTKDYAQAALGHHRWYNGQGGYPETYHREESPDAVLVDILSVADYIDRNLDMTENRRGEAESPVELQQTLRGTSGSRLAPHFVEIALQNWQEIQEAMENGRKEAYKKVYEEYR